MPATSDATHRSAHRLLGRKVLIAATALPLLLGLGMTASTASNSSGPAPLGPIPPANATTAPLSERPNIVLITADDQALVEMESLPKTRRLLGKAGVTFRNMLAPHPNCCPARAQILTGQYAHNNGVATNSPPNGGWAGLKPATAMPVWLQRAGYQTGFVGKYLHGYDETNDVEPGWDRWRPFVTKPLSSYYDLVQLDDGVIRRYPANVYNTERIAMQARGMVNDFADADAPFFLWTSYIAPHGSCETTEENDCSGPPLPSAKYKNMRIDKRLPSLDSPSYNEADFSDKPGPGIIPQKLQSARAQQKLFEARARALASLDDSVTKTVRALKHAGVLDDTVIMFTSDNGYMFGEHRQTGKVLAYEESIRVPLLMRGPNVPKGEVRRQTVAMIDLAPTIANLAGATPLVPVDGIDIAPYVVRNKPQGDRALLVQAGARKEPGAYRYRAVRTKRYTYIDWAHSAKDELYDREVDPWQMRSVSQRAAYRPVKAKLETLLRQLETCSGDTCQVHGPGAH